jgi:hypothetical protein
MLNHHLFKKFKFIKIHKFNYLIYILSGNMNVAALESCRQLLSLALDHLNGTLFSSSLSLLDVADDLQTWLSSAGTHQETCKDGFENANATAKSNIDNWLKNSTELTSNSLAIVSWISKIESALNLRRRRLMSFDPEWLNSKDRKLLENSDLTTQANIVVAQDGSGHCKNISDALKAVPDKSSTRFVIYVKKGIYYENVQINKNKWNVLMVGDGMNDTIVSGGLNFVDGTPTYSTATFAVAGKGFIAIDMGFCNTAGAIKHQAVALLSDSDKSVFYRLLNHHLFQKFIYFLLLFNAGRRGNGNSRKIKNKITKGDIIFLRIFENRSNKLSGRNARAPYSIILECFFFFFFFIIIIKNRMSCQNKMTLIKRTLE